MRASLLFLALIAAGALASPAAAGPDPGPSRCGPMPRARGPWKCVAAVKQSHGQQQHKQVEWVWVKG